jgi:type I restriction enzyme S subunit
MTGIREQSGKRARYPAYAPSEVEWLGDVPRHWKIRRMKYSADLVNHKIDGRDSELPYTGLEHIESWTGRRLAPNGDITGEGQANLYKSGDVLFGKLRPYLAKAYAADSDGICTGELLVLRPKAVQQKFLLDYLLNPDVISIVDSSTYGAKMPRANWDFIGNLPVLIPPAEEQRIIIAFLDRETARIDALIGKKQRQIELLREKRSALISHAVTKGLDRNAKMKDSGIEWLGEIPEHWEVKRLKRFAHLRSGKSITAYEIDENGKYPVYGGNGLRGFTDSYTHKGDFVLIGRQGALCGCINYATGCFWASEHAVVVSIKGDIKTRWLGELLRSMNLNQYSQSAAQPGLAVETIAALFLPVPPPAEQHNISAFLDRETEGIDVLIEKVEKSISLLREYRTALISTAVTGKIDVREEVVV